ncbi:hypothetical protein LW139_07140 [Proteus vulgaris]|uniref:hypothetical protein n=1 Tax=Proteus vulgaris TaxID=585 RepID=UPI001FFFCF58|nr:hypothetical protein [Proteus vulgaris]UPK82459.1 hypothetical protein LW139_07140 [Proteus vulgaris]
MKLLIVAALLFSTPVMAANQYNPDNVCLKFESSNASKEVRCKSISTASIVDNDDHGQVLSVSVYRRQAIHDYNQEYNHSESKIYIMNEEFKLQFETDKNVIMDLMLILDNQRKSKAAEELISCHDYLRSNKLLSRS